jgi:hypothetical protein
MKILLTLFVLLFSFNVSGYNIVYYKGTWLCIEEASIGFDWNKQTSSWVQAKWELEKHIIKSYDDKHCYEEHRLRENQFCATHHRIGHYKNDIKTWISFYAGDKFQNHETSIYGDFWSGIIHISEKGKFGFSMNIPMDPLKKGRFNGDKDPVILSHGTCSKI